MKISEINTDQLCDVLCSLTEPITNIVSDQKLINELKKDMGLKDDATQSETMTAGAKKITALFPILLKNHRQDVYKILAIMDEKQVNDIGTQNAMETIKIIKELTQDKDFMDFFK